MKGNDKLIQVLNQLLADELTAISQYMLHAEICASYEKLHEAIEKQAIDEMRHAEWLIARIIFFEGKPIVSKLNPIRVGQAVPEIIEYDYQAEVAAVEAYNAAISLAQEVADHASADLLIKILNDEEKHADWGEIQQEQIEQMGLGNYLATQISGAE